MDLVFEFYLHFYWHFLSFPFDLIPATLVRVLTPSVSPNEKTFKVVLVCCSCDPSPHPPSIFGGFSGSFASVCSCPLGVPVTSPLFLASFEHFLQFVCLRLFLSLTVFTLLFSPRNCNAILPSVVQRQGTESP